MGKIGYENIKVVIVSVVVLVDGLVLSACISYSISILDVDQCLTISTSKDKLTPAGATYKGKYAQLGSIDEEKVEKLGSTSEGTLPHHKNCAPDKVGT